MSFDTVRRSAREKVLADSRLLTFAEIQRRWGISPAVVREIIARGELAPVVVGKRQRVAETEWLRYLSRGVVQASA